jgi:Kef-type K+ transport system membrane component KefB
MGFDAELVRSITGLIFGTSSAFFAVAFFLMYSAGRVVTEDADRSDLGKKAGRFFVSVGVVFACVTMLAVSRWHDLDGDRDGPLWVGTAISVVGIAAIAYGVYLAWRVGPALMRLMRKAWKMEREGRF